MTLIRFATCDRRMALRFLAKYYPSFQVNDEGATAEVLDLVEKDIIRIPDPSFHPNGVITMPKGVAKDVEMNAIEKLQTMHNLFTA